jgi:hypothetical protein
MLVKSQSDFFLRVAFGGFAGVRETGGEIGTQQSSQNSPKLNLAKVP